MNGSGIGIIAMAILIGIFIMGCTSSQQPQSASNPTLNTIAQNSSVQEFHLNEIVNADNVTFTADSWGFTDRWGTVYPSKGAKLLWVHFVSENMGEVPGSVPYDFHVGYRGANAKTANMAMGKLDYLYDVYQAQMWEGEIYKGDGMDGFLLFEVMDDLGASEANFSVNFKGKQYVLRLEQPAEVKGALMTISDEKLICEPQSGFLPYQHCRIGFTLTNNLPTPFISQGEVGGVQLNYTINGKYSNQRIPQSPDYYLDTDGTGGSPGNIRIGPKQTAKDCCSTATLATLDNESGIYYMYYSDPALVGKDASIPLGKDGDSVDVSITIFGANGKVYAENDSAQIMLTMVSS